MADKCCIFHNHAGEALGRANPSPQLSCPLCRRFGYFTERTLREFLAEEDEKNLRPMVVNQNGSTYRIVRCGDMTKPLVRHYRVVLVQGAWPLEDVKKTLIRMCDGDKPFGGHVFIDGVEASVDCYR